MSKITDISIKCINLIEQFECSGNVNSSKWLRAYQDTGGVWTIGIGTTRYFGGTKVQKGDVITPKQAYQCLHYDLQHAALDVDALTVDSINQNQFDALVSFGYNAGTGQAGYKGSSLRRIINANPNDFDAIIAQFLRWEYDDGIKEPGLLRRRKSEAWLYQYGELKWFE